MGVSLRDILNEPTALLHFVLWLLLRTALLLGAVALMPYPSKESDHHERAYTGSDTNPVNGGAL